VTEFSTWADICPQTQIRHCLQRYRISRPNSSANRCLTLVSRLRITSGLQFGCARNSLEAMSPMVVVHPS
jgi:hypothetical protein